MSYASTIMANLSKTQNLDFIRQLHLGIRVFDIRQCYQDEEIWTTHGMISYPLYDQFRYIKRFALAHPKEIIMIIISHSYNFTAEIHKENMKKIEEIFGDLIASRNEFNVKSTYKKFINNKKNVIISYKSSNYHYTDSILWKSGNVEGSYPNMTDPEKAMDHVENLMKDRSMDVMFKASPILTPDEKWVALHLTSSTLKLSEEINDLLRERLTGSWLNDPNWNSKVNIVSFDQVDYKDLTELIVKLND